jgi:hypothetical protein
MGNLLQVVSLMAVPMLILVAIGYRNWRDGRWPTERSRHRPGGAAAPAARNVPVPPLHEVTRHTH